MGKREKDNLFCDEKERKSIILSKSAQREKKKDVHLRSRRSQERRGLKPYDLNYTWSTAESPLARAAWIETCVLGNLAVYKQVAARKSGVD